MPPKKAQLRTHLYSENELAAFIEKDGLKVIDAYTEWCGPCHALENALRTLKTDAADETLLYATACTDKIPSLKPYYGTSEPIMLFYSGIVLVNVLRGANAPELLSLIKIELQNEHEAREGKRQRVPFTGLGPQADSRQASAKKPRRSTTQRPSIAKIDENKPGKEYTFAMIKPTAVAEGNADAIFARLAEEGFKVVAQDDVLLTKERAAAFYAEHIGKPFFERLVEYMSSGPLKPLILSAPDAVAKWRALIGPTNLDKARQEAPQSLRALYAKENPANAVHGSDGKAAAEREIEFFFPEWAAANLPVEQVVLLVAPDVATSAVCQQITESLQRSNFEIRDTRPAIEVSDFQVRQLFGEEVNPEVVTLLSSNGQKCAAFVARRVRARQVMEEIVGPVDVAEAKAKMPDSLRAKFGTDAVKCGVMIIDNTERAVQAFFGDNQELISEYKAGQDAVPSTVPPATVEEAAGEEEEVVLEAQPAEKTEVAVEDQQPQPQQEQEPAVVMAEEPVKSQVPATAETAVMGEEGAQAQPAASD